MKKAKESVPQHTAGKPVALVSVLTENEPPPALPEGYELQETVPAGLTAPPPEEDQPEETKPEEKE